jgi:prolyl-tRNA editing enzyme YbaK/EbsC (Cys-tRNA(Pro) deacylase)
VSDLPEASRRLASSIDDFVMATRVFPEGTKTAEDAARAVGCSVSAIVKSLVFVVIDDEGSEEPVVALVPGDLRLDTDRLAAVAGATGSRRASLDEVRQATGFAAGGTPPFGHAGRFASSPTTGYVATSRFGRPPALRPPSSPYRSPTSIVSPNRSGKI